MFDDLRRNLLCSGWRNSLCGGWGKVRASSYLGLFGPNQNPTILLDRQPPYVHKFELEVLKAFVVQFEYPAERAARYALLALEQRRRQRQLVKETHRVLAELAEYDS
jgi:hypothetical protein